MYNEIKANMFKAIPPCTSNSICTLVDNQIIEASNVRRERVFDRFNIFVHQV